MSERAQRLRRIGESRSTIRHNLNERDTRAEATRYVKSIRVAR